MMNERKKLIGICSLLGIVAAACLGEVVYVESYGRKLLRELKQTKATIVQDLERGDTLTARDDFGEYCGGYVDDKKLACRAIDFSAISPFGWKIISSVASARKSVDSLDDVIKYEYRVGKDQQSVLCRIVYRLNFSNSDDSPEIKQIYKQLDEQYGQDSRYLIFKHKGGIEVLEALNGNEWEHD